MAIYGKLRDLLLEAGLNESECHVYIELLKKPCQTVWELVTRTGLSKSVAYRAFTRLHNLKMVEKSELGIRALTLKSFVSELVRRERRLSKIAYKIKQVAPFLRAPHESIEEFETFYTPGQIADAYVAMSELDFGVSLDFGDFEHFVPIIGGIHPVHMFRTNRVKKATAHAVCTTNGPYTAEFCTQEAKVKFKNTVDFAKLDFKNNFVVFSDRSDYVLFNTFSDAEYPSSVLVKSKPIADVQRMQLKSFSQHAGNE